MKKLLLSARGLAVSVCRYAPGERHPPHTDRHSRISFLLRGGYREETSAAAIRMRPSDVLLKSSRARHEDVFGETGAILAALEFIDDADPFDHLSGVPAWRRRADAFALRHATAFLEAALAGDAESARAAGADLLADTEDSASRAKPPPWLDRLKCELEHAALATVDVAARARAAGAHVAHASRLFRRCYGASITQHAQAQSVRRALGQLAEPDQSLSDIALAAGFYDQSHMNRVFRRITGRTPAACRALMAAAC